MDEAAGPAVSVCFTGEAGIGKTTALLRVAAGAPRLLGGGLLATRSRPRFALERALRSWLAGDEDAVVDAVARAVPEGGVLVLDDLQWVDAETLALLPRLAGRLPVLVAVRTHDPGTAPALDAVAAAGIPVVAVAPLDDEATRHAGGNPMAAEQLAARGDLDALLYEALAAATDYLGDAATTVLATLALAGGPVAATAFDDTLSELCGAAVVSRDGDTVSIRNAPAAERAVERLDGNERRAVHARLAELARNDADRARHLFAAGEPSTALPLARAAADTASSPADRSELLELVARCAGSEEAPTALTQAAEAAVEAGDVARGRALAAEALAASGEHRARASVVAAEAAALAGDAGEALDLVAGIAPSAPAAVRIRAAALRAKTLAWPLWRPGDALSAAEEAAALLGEGDDASSARVAASAAAARVVAGRPDWREGAPPALLAWGELLDGRGDVAEAIAAELLQQEPDLPAALVAAVIAVHRAGSCDRAQLGAIASAGTPGVTAEVATAHLAIVLADSGRTGAAADVAATELASATTPAGRALLGWALVEAELGAARLTRCAKAAERALATVDEPFPTDPLVHLALRWARLQSGAAPGSDELPDSPWKALAPAADEYAGIAALHAGDFAGARERFSRAAERWAPVHARAALRCRWAAAVAFLRAGSRDGIDELRSVEAAAAALGQLPLVARCRASLREVGVRSTPKRGGGVGPLTAREAEVLEMVRSGLTTTEISNVLGVAPSTVETQIESAMRRLGARTRTQAVSLLGELTNR